MVSNDVASIGDFTTRILALNVYRDFAAAHRALTPYIGAGLGVAFVKVSDVQYTNDYQDTAESPPVYEPPLSFYNSITDVNYSDTVVAGRLHAGVDCDLNDRMLFGAKLTYTLVDDMADTGVYDSHPIQQEADEKKEHEDANTQKELHFARMLDDPGDRPQQKPAKV